MKFASPQSMAERLSNPIEFVDRQGNQNRFRIFLWMKNYGLLDDMLDIVIVPAHKGYTTIRVYSDLDLIVAGGTIKGWDIYSLQGKFLKHYPAMDINMVPVELKLW